MEMLIGLFLGLTLGFVGGVNYGYWDARRMLRATLKKEFDK